MSDNTKKWGETNLKGVALTPQIRKKNNNKRITPDLEYIARQNIKTNSQRRFLEGLLRFQRDHFQLTERQWKAFKSLLKEGK